MPTAIINGIATEVNTPEEHAAIMLAEEAEALWSMGANPEGSHGPYVAGREVVIECYAPGHEYVSDKDCTRVPVEITEAIIARAKAIIEERSAQVNA